MNRTTPNLLVLVILILLLAATACNRTTSTAPASTSTDSSATSTRIASVDVVEVSTPQIEIPAGGSGEATVMLKIRSGYHVNANPPTYSYLKATELEVQPAGGLSVAYLTYPNALTKKFSFEEKPLAVYEGQTPLRVMLKAEKTAAKGAASLVAKLRVQACDDQVCYPPGTKDLTIPVVIK